MSQASEIAAQAKGATEIYEIIGESGATYIFFWFPDNSVTVARRKHAGGSVAATYEFGKNVKGALDDCGMGDVDGTTYQKGRELLKRIRGE